MERKEKGFRNLLGFLRIYRVCLKSRAAGHCEGRGGKSKKQQEVN